MNVTMNANKEVIVIYKKIKDSEIIPTPTPVPPSSSNNKPNVGNTTSDGYVVPNTGVK